MCTKSLMLGPSLCLSWLMPKKQKISYKEFNMVSQNSHWLAGTTWVFGTIILFGAQYLLYSVLAAVFLAALKEFWYDYKYETKEVRGSSIEDFMFYLVGLLIALLLYIYWGLAIRVNAPSC